MTTTTTETMTTTIELLEHQAQLLDFTEQLRETTSDHEERIHKLETIIKATAETINHLLAITHEQRTLRDDKGECWSEY